MVAGPLPVDDLCEYELLEGAAVGEETACPQLRRETGDRAASGDTNLGSGRENKQLN